MYVCACYCVCVYVIVSVCVCLCGCVLVSSVATQYSTPEPGRGIQGAGAHLHVMSLPPPPPHSGTRTLLRTQQMFAPQAARCDDPRWDAVPLNDPATRWAGNCVAILPLRKFVRKAVCTNPRECALWDDILVTAAAKVPVCNGDVRCHQITWFLDVFCLGMHLPGKDVLALLVCAGNLFEMRKVCASLVRRMTADALDRPSPVGAVDVVSASLSGPCSSRGHVHRRFQRYPRRNTPNPYRRT